MLPSFRLESARLVDRRPFGWARAASTAPRLLCGIALLSLVGCAPVTYYAGRQIRADVEPELDRVKQTAAAMKPWEACRYLGQEIDSGRFENASVLGAWSELEVLDQWKTDACKKAAALGEPPPPRSLAAVQGDLANRPDDPELLNLAGLSLLSQKKPQEALPYFRRAVEGSVTIWNDPLRRKNSFCSDVLVARYLNLAITLRETGAASEALEVMEALIATKVPSARGYEVLMEIGESALAASRPGDAARAFAEAHDASSVLWLPGRGFGGGSYRESCRTLMDDVYEKQRDPRAVIGLRPDTRPYIESDKRLLVRSGRLFLQAGDPGSAQVQFAKAAEWLTSGSDTIQVQTASDEKNREEANRASADKALKDELRPQIVSGIAASKEMASVQQAEADALRSEKNRAEDAARRASPAFWAKTLREKTTQLAYALKYANDLVGRGYGTLAVDKEWPKVFEVEEDLCSAVAVMKSALPTEQIREVVVLASKAVAYASGDAEGAAMEAMLGDYVARAPDRCATLGAEGIERADSIPKPAHSRQPQVPKCLHSRHRGVSRLVRISCP